MSDSLLTEETMEWIDRETGPGEPITIEKGMVRQLAEAIRDDNPLYRDEASAKESAYEGIPMPPPYLLTNLNSGAERNLEIPVKAKRRVRGGDELIVHKPILVGDTIRANTKVVSIKEKEGRTGKMVFITTETTYSDDGGEVRMVARTTVIKR